ncbi:MAG: helix-turn-helix transcriptional regulator [Bacillota bacterium]
MLGIKIRQSREQQGISQEKLAELVGVSRQAVSKWELEQASPTIDNLKRTEEALGLPPGTLIELAAAEELEPAAETGVSKRKYYLLGCVAVTFLAISFFLGRLSAPEMQSPSSPGDHEVTLTLHTPTGLAEGEQVTFPVAEDGMVHLDMPLSAPGEESRLAAQMKFYQWPESLPLDKQPLTDFDLNLPWGSPEKYLSKGWKLVSEAAMGENASLGLARTVEEYDGPTLWILGRSGKGEPWVVLERLPEDSMNWKDAKTGDRAWAVSVGNVLGYESMRVDYGESTILLSLVEGQPRIIFRFDSLQGFADLDMDGELEVVCRPAESPFEIYDREPDGYYRYTFTNEISHLSIPENLEFVFDERGRAFGFENYLTTQPYLMEEAPVYDRLSSGGCLWRRDGTHDERCLSENIHNTAVTFQVPRPDERKGWALDGTPLPTPRQQGAVLLREMEALTECHLDRCYIWGDAGWQQVSLEQDWNSRTFFDMSYSLPNYYENGSLVDNSNVISNMVLFWRSEFRPWSPLVKENVTLPAGWKDWTEKEKGLWWYHKSSYFNRGEIASIEPSQYEGTMKFNLENGDFLEVCLDEDGFLISIYGPYLKGTIH